jgi:hypothetical protein
MATQMLGKVSQLTGGDDYQNDGCGKKHPRAKEIQEKRKTKVSSLSTIDVRRRVSKGVEDSRRLPVLRAGHP